MVSLDYLACRKENMPSTIIVGAGWAGLKCAYTLSKAAHQITLIDAAPQSGGRARAVPFQQHTVDNGQHICIGAYHTLRQLLRELELDEKELFQILPMELFAHGNQTLHLKLVNLPAPFNLLAGLLAAKNIPWGSKYQILSLCWYLRKNNFRLDTDIVLLDFLKNYHQSDFVIQHVWEPIALATMTTPINQASTQIFLNILKRVFYSQNNDSNWYLPATDLSSLLPTHIENYLRQRGHELIYGHTIKQLHIVENKCHKISGNNKDWHADNIVLAMPPWQALQLLQTHPELSSVSLALTNFSFQPITTIYFEFSEPPCLPYPMLALLNTTCQWIFDRAFSGQANIISAVISGPGTHQNLTQEMLAKTVFAEIKSVFPHLAEPINQRVINEKRAAFNCTPDIQQHRPCAKAKLSNLWLTGDYIQTDLPSTLEGALLSGRRTAEEILGSAIDS